MPKKNERDTAAVFRLKQDVAKVRRRAARWLAGSEKSSQEAPADPDEHKKRIYEVFRSMDEWW